MKKIIALSLTILMMASFSSCQKAQERPAKLHKDIDGKVVALNDLSDVTRSENQNSEANLTFKRSLVSKISDTEKRDQANLLLSQDKLTYRLAEGKVLILEVTENSESDEFTVLAEIGMTTGILENERTDYNEKKSILKLTETSLAEARYLMLKDEITTYASDGAEQ